MSPEFLSARGEQAWTWLRRHLDRAQSFWLGFVFTDNLATASILATRARANRKAKAEPFKQFSPATADELSALLEQLEEEAPAPLGCTWIEAVHLADPAWEDAWSRFLQALNHRRDYLRDRLGGLVVVAPPAVKAYAQQYSADLWSVRDLLVELPTESLPELPTPLLGDLTLPGEQRVSFRGLSYGELDPALADEVTAVLALPAEQLASSARGRAAELTDLARASGNNQLAAVLLLARARDYVDAEDAAAALDLLRCGIRLDGVDDPTLYRLLDFAAQLSRNADKVDDAIEIEKEAVAIAEKMEDEYLNAVSLSKLANAYSARGDWDAAKPHYEQALDIREQLAARFGTDAAYRGVAASALQLGSVYAAAEDWDTAAEYYSRAHAISERLAQQADTFANRMNVAIALSVLGGAALLKNDITTATQQLTQAIHTFEQLSEQPGDNQDIQQLLARGLLLLGNANAMSANRTAAAEHSARAVKIYQGLADEHGTFTAFQHLRSGLEFAIGSETAVGNNDTATEYQARLDEIERRLSS
jgi:tetratricopeptide (TPR) repeat protein